MRKSFILVLSVWFLAACMVVSTSQPAANFVKLPDTERAALTAVIVAVLGFILAKLTELIPWSAPFVEKYRLEISLAIAAAVVGVIENALPSAYPEASILFIQLLLAVLAATGLFGLLKKSDVPGFH